MASSQIEIASSSPSFGCILRDHNQRERFRENENGRLAFQKNIKEFVKDFHACSSATTSSTPTATISISAKTSSSRPIYSTETTPYGLRKINARRSPSPENKKGHSLHREPALARSAGNSPSMVGASSLVQMWEARVNHSNSFNNKMMNSSNASSRTNSGLSVMEFASSSSVSESTKEPADIENVVNQSQLSPQSPEEPIVVEPQQQVLEATKSEPVKVADIIKRLTKTSSCGDEGCTSSGNNELEEQQQTKDSSQDADSSQSCPLSSLSTSSPRITERSLAISGQSGQHISGTSSPRVVPKSSTSDGRLAFPQISNAPRLRGRQAFQDLLTQMKRDRRSEIHSLGAREVVSKFAQKGRIQSMLRLKVLRRGLMSPPDHQIPSAPTWPKLASSSIANRRSRFDPEAESLATLNRIEDESGLEESHEEDTSSTTRNETGTSSISSTPCDRISLCQQNVTTDNTEAEVNVKRLGENSSWHKDLPKGACKSGTCSTLRRSFDGSLRHETTISTTNATSNSSPAAEQHLVPTLRQRDSDTSEDIHEVSSLNSYVTWQDPSFETRSVGVQGNEDSGWDGHGSMISAEEPDDNSQQYAAESSYNDWFSDISRPRRYWEDLRRAWYQEVLETTSENAEIRQLLERKTVSSFLDSSFRLRMDQLMMSRLSNRTRPQNEDAESEDTTNQVTMRLSERQPGRSSQQQQEEQNPEQIDQGDEEQDEFEEREDDGLLGSDYNDVRAYFERNPTSPQLPLPSPMSSAWSSFREPEPSEESEQAESRPNRSPFHYASIRQAPTTHSTNHTSLEMELIYDLKGHMEQLYQEMNELRKSINCCIDMQETLQLSFKQEILSVGVERNNTSSGTPPPPLKKGSCCICYEMPVDSLLYRCGHMCTCLKCAQELQWSSGKCPICRARIMDVVRAYTADS